MSEVKTIVKMENSYWQTGPIISGSSVIIVSCVEGKEYPVSLKDSTIVLDRRISEDTGSFLVEPQVFTIGHIKGEFELFVGDLEVDFNDESFILATPKRTFSSQLIAKTKINNSSIYPGSYYEIKTHSLEHIPWEYTLIDEHEFDRINPFMKIRIVKINDVYDSDSNLLTKDQVLTRESEFNRGGSPGKGFTLKELVQGGSIFPCHVETTCGISNCHGPCPLGFMCQNVGGKFGCRDTRIAPKENYLMIILVVIIAIVGVAAGVLLTNKK